VGRERLHLPRRGGGGDRERPLRDSHREHIFADAAGPGDGGRVARLSDGRAVLGLGASHPGVVKRLHGLEYSRPVRRIHETAEAIHALTDAGKFVSYDGQTFSTEGFPGLDEPVPIYNAALGEANRRATGRVADGWLPYLLPFSELDDAFETIERTAREASRDPDAIETLPQVLAVVDEDPDAARRPIREYLANYVGNYANYRRIVAEQFSDEVAAITEAWEAGNEATAVS
jgi:5,10-methylenetetrahydromethanopterin reductase